jgi:hypothetical protein
MSQVLTVPTHFNDIGELSEGFLDRVERDTLILYGPVPYEDGSEIDFVVLLADGTPAIEGTGRVRAAVDGGAERVLETRYDVVLESLQLDGRCTVVFERLVLARQAVSDRPPVEDGEPPTNEMTAVPAADEGVTEEAEPISEEVELVAEEAELEADEVFSVPPEHLAPDTVPPTASVGADAYADSDEEEDDPVTVIAAVDAESIMAEAVDSEYAFEHGIAAEPRVGMPVPIPSMAAPPEARSAPPTLRLAQPPEGLTRPSLSRVEEALFTADGEVSDVHTTGLFVYEEGLPIPARPPLPDPAGPQRARPVEAEAGYDVEESEPPSADDEEYEEIRLSDFAGAVEKV